MKYNIYINQKSFVENFPKIDILGACIYDTLKSYCSSSSERIKKDIIDGKEYARITYEMITEDLPIIFLNLKSKKAVFSRLKELKKYKIIDSQTFINEKGYRSFRIRITEEARKLEFFENVNLLPEGNGDKEDNKKGQTLLPEGNGPISPGKCTIEISSITNYIDEIDETKANLISNKLVEIYEESIGIVRLKTKVALKFKELLKTFKAEELEEIIIKKSKDDWFIKNLAKKGPTWFLSNKSRLERYLDGD